MVLVFETCCVQRVPLPQWNSASKCKPTTTWSAQHKTRWSFTALEIKPKAVRLAARNTLRGWTVVYLKSHPSDFLREMFKNNVDFFFFFFKLSLNGEPWNLLCLPAACTHPGSFGSLYLRLRRQWSQWTGTLSNFRWLHPLRKCRITLDKCLYIQILKLSLWQKWQQISQNE